MIDAIESEPLNCAKTTRREVGEGVLVRINMPTASEYNQAIQNLRLTAADQELQAGEPVLSPLGLPLEFSGNFAVVYQVRCSGTGKSWAVKCFTKEVSHRRERYEAISRHLRQARLPFFVGFEYQHQGLLVKGDWHPIVKMDWVEGLQLDAFLRQCFRKGNPGDRLQMLCRKWQQLAEQLRAANVAHGDLQHGNVLLVPVPGRAAYRLQLVDYDGMYVPALANLPPGEMGHAAYQHPQRFETGAYSLDIDRFSHLLIYTTLRCLIAGGQQFWKGSNPADRLLFEPHDLAAPQDSPVFRELWQLEDPAARSLLCRLILALKGPLNDVPALNQVIVDSRVVALTERQQTFVTALLAGESQPAHELQTLPTFSDEREDLFADSLPEAVSSRLSHNRPTNTTETGAPLLPPMNAGTAPRTAPVRRASAEKDAPQPSTEENHTWWVVAALLAVLALPLFLAGLVIFSKPPNEVALSKLEQKAETFADIAKPSLQTREHGLASPTAPDAPEQLAPSDNGESENWECPEVPLVTPPRASSRTNDVPLGTEVSWKGRLQRILVVDGGQDTRSRRIPRGQVLRLLVTNVDPNEGPPVFEAVTTDLSFARELADYQSEFEAPGRADSVRVRGEVVDGTRDSRLDQRVPLLQLLSVQREAGASAVRGRDLDHLRNDQEQIALATQLRVEGARLSFTGTINKVGRDTSQAQVHVDALGRYYCVAVSPENLKGLQNGDPVHVDATVTSRYATYASQERIYQLPLLEGTVKPLAITPPMVLSSDLQAPLVVHRPRIELVGAKGAVRFLSWSPDGNYLATGGAGANVVLWNLTTTRQPRYLTGNWAYATALKWPDDGRIILLDTIETRRRFLSSSSVRKVRLIVANTHHFLADFPVEPSYSNGILATVDGRAIKVGPYPHLQRNVTEFLASRTVSAIALSPDGQLLAIADISLKSRNAVYVQDVARTQLDSAKTERVELGIPGAELQDTQRLVWRRNSHCGSDYLMAQSSNQIVLWELDANAARQAEPVIINPPRGDHYRVPRADHVVSWSTDGQLLAVLGTGQSATVPNEFRGSFNRPRSETSPDSVVNVFQITGGFQQLAEISGRFLAVAFAPHSHHLACLSADGDVLVYDLNAGTGVIEFRSSRPATSLAWKPTAQRLAMGHFDGIVTIWDLQPQTTGEIRIRIDVEAKIRELRAAGARRDRTEFNHLLEQIRTQQLSAKHIRSLQQVVKSYPK